MPPNNNIGELLKLIFAKSQYENKLGKKNRAEADRIDRYNRQGATAGAVGQGVGTLSNLAMMYGGMGAGGAPSVPASNSAPTAMDSQYPDPYALWGK